MKKLRLVAEVLRATRQGAPLGDIAALKISGFRRPSQKIQTLLSKMRGYVPAVDIETLRAQPEGSLGREYARFLDANGIEPLDFSEAIKQRFANDPYTIRYAATHDLHHTLTGFDTGLAGEVGVFAFTVGQGIIAGPWYLWLARLLYPLFAPLQVRVIWNNVRVGYEMGQRANLLLSEPIEDQFRRPIAEVRQEYNIPAPATSGVLPSGKNPVVDAIYQLLYRKQPRAQTASQPVQHPRVA